MAAWINEECMLIPSSTDSEKVRQGERRPGIAASSRTGFPRFELGGGLIP